MLDVFFQFLTKFGPPTVEILIIAVIFYYGHIYFKKVRGAWILMLLAMAILMLTYISQHLHLVVIAWIVRSFSAILAVGLVVIFQPELRRALLELRSHPIFGTGFQKKEVIEEIVDSVFELSSKTFGALIAIERDVDLQSLIETGVETDCVYSKELVLTIFHPKTALHDGGIVIRGERIAAAACVFPLSQREDLDRSLGLRHRAGIGLTEEFDAIAIVVSEETGQIAICHNGTIDRNLNMEKFRRRLTELLFEEKYDKNSSEQLEGKTDIAHSGDGSLVSHPTKRGEGNLPS